MTPLDKPGVPEGGRRFSAFIQIMRTGILDHLHPNCSLEVTANCRPYPFDVAFLQIMR
jgi:hypothetical protein